MTPKNKIEEIHKNQKDQLQLSFKIINYYLCAEDIQNYLERKRKKQ